MTGRRRPQMPGTRGRLALHRGHKAPAACNRRFVPPAVRRREQDEIDARKWLERGVHPQLVEITIALRGSW